MRRPLSNFALSAWAGFAASHAFLLGCAAAAVAPAAFVETRTGLSLALPEASLPTLDAGVGAAALVAATVALGLSLVRLNGRRIADRARGERLAASALTGIAVLFGAAALAGSPLGATAGGAIFAFALALTLGAMLFDHAMDEESIEADAAFRDALSSAAGHASRPAGRLNRREDER